MWYMRHVIMRTTVATIQDPAADDDDGDDDDDSTTRACGPHGIFLQGIVAPGRRANAVERACESSSRELM